MGCVIQVDDGLPLRKASFACVDTLLDSLPHVLEMSSFMPYLAKGLEDKVRCQRFSPIHHAFEALA